MIKALNDAFNYAEMVRNKSLPIQIKVLSMPTRPYAAWPWADCLNLTGNWQRFMSRCGAEIYNSCR